MPPEETPATPQAGDDGQPQAGTDPATPEQSGQEPKTFDAAYVQAIRNEAAKHRREAADLARWKAERERADLTQSERDAARIKEYEAKEQAWEREKRDLRLQTAITAAATKAGALYPEQLHRLVDADAVEWNDATGQPRNLTGVVGELKREYPALFRSHGGAGNADAGAGGGARPQQSMNDLIRRAAGRE